MSSLVDSEDGEYLMDDSKAEKYLGMVVSRDGSNMKNIESRISKGIAATNEVMSILNNNYFGPFYFQVFVTLRNALFINSILSNSSAWYNLKQYDIDKLSKCDASLITKGLSANPKTSSIFIYLEMGMTPVAFILKSRRLLFLHYILNESEDSTLFKFFHAQSRAPIRGDWALTIREDLKELNISYTFEEIKQMSKEQFRKIVSESVQLQSFKYLNEKKLTQSKIKHIKYEKLQMQEYLKPNRISNNLAKFIFHARSSMLDIAGNYRSKYKNETHCRSCMDQTQSETQFHVFNCISLASSEVTSRGSSVQYFDLFNGDLEKQVTAASILQARLKMRDKIIKSRENNQPS